jgi:hypothetical protein
MRQNRRAEADNAEPLETAQSAPPILVVGGRQGDTRDKDKRQR